ncbi:hypothetical protein [Nocardia bovistercoris]|uniref:Lipoprotein n=1 Tax=Nocardia bovistercoris TaxID=2785916 RepID=A0A931I702_9NOCA|nr:hypothetical protein [Nocardia bovistercoris]MBH0776039.1 hypothetical protein [Nocardia bovistercoris]
MRRLERVGLTAATAATAIGVLFVGACSTQVEGTAEVNRTDLAAYQSDVTASSIAASSSRAAAAQAATESACDAFFAANESSVGTFNAYIEASNNNAPDTNPKADAAVTTLRAGAQSVDRALTTQVESDVAQKLRAYRDDTNALAGTLERRADTDTLNAAIDKFNNTKNAARDSCRAY